MSSTLASYLEKYKTMLPPRKAVRASVANAVARAVGVEIPPERVKIERGTAFVSSFDANLRHAILLNKSGILAELAAALGPRAPKDIR